MRQRKNERGQVLVLTVLFLGALFGFAAIALDGGNIYADRRSAQAAADSASLAGALAVMRGYSHGNVVKVSENRAVRNGYADVAGKTDVWVFWPPCGGVTACPPSVSPHPYADNSNYVQVIITNRMDTILAHLFYSGPFQHTVEATAHAGRNETLAPGYAVYADNPTACPGIEFAGSLDAVVSGGGSILSNSSASCGCGGPNTGSGYGHGGGSATVVDPTGRAGIFSVGCWEDGTLDYNLPGGGGPSDGAGQEYVDPPPLPDCTGLPYFGDQSFTGGNHTLFPGRYNSISGGGSAIIILSPGIYCLEGSASGGGNLALSMGATSDLIGPDPVAPSPKGVMLYLTDTAGGVQMLGDGLVQLAAGDPSGASTPALVDASGEDWRGMLFYVHPNNTNEIDLRGGADSAYTGTIYAPGSHCEMHGDAGVVAFNTQMICDTVLITGNGTMEVNFDPARLYHREDRIELTH